MKRPDIRPTDLSDEQRNHYLQWQLDPIAGKQTSRFLLKKQDDGWALSSTVGLSVQLPRNGEVDWQSADSARQSEALWKYSVGWLPQLLEESSDFELVEALLRSLYSYSKTSAWEETSSWMASLDHAYAMRIRSICTLSCMYRDAGREIPDVALAVLESDVQQIMDDPARFLPVNNHGAMVAMALVHATQMFDGLPGEAYDKAWSALREIVDDIFDTQGVAGENSPEYQSYWISLLDGLARMVEAWPLPETQSGFDLKARVDLARSALGHFTDRSGRYLPIGDSNPASSKAKPAINSILVSEQQGFVCYSVEHCQFTFNCGHTNYSHKHCDDTSITLAYRGTPLVLDSGFYGHDWQDPSVIFSKSQSAHSGLFFEEFDDLHPGNLYFPGREVLSGGLRKSDDENEFVGVVAVRDGRSLRRRVRILGPTRIELSDYAFVPSEEDTRVVRRFILPGEAEVDMKDGCVTAKVGDVVLDISYEPENAPLPPLLRRGEISPNRRGWICPKLFEFVPAYCLEIPLKVNQESIMRLKVRDRPGFSEKELELLSAIRGERRF